jgi:deoxyadenosine/deoxycytidine kinase
MYTIVSVEGNIGSGKTTLLENLRKHFKDNEYVIFLKEPVDEWEKIHDESGTTMLEKFYANQEKYAFPFQMMAYISRLKVFLDTLKEMNKKTENNNIIIITERSLYTDKMVFAKLLYDTGKIEYVNYQIYLSWFDTFSEEFPVHKVIYVKASPETCFQRIGKRSREGESNIPISYLDSCNTYHDYMLDKSLDTCVCHHQLLLDGNNDIYENKNLLKDWIQHIENFIF